MTEILPLGCISILIAKYFAENSQIKRKTVWVKIIQIQIRFSLTEE